MCVFKYHAFIYFLRPPPWYGTLRFTYILVYRFMYMFTYRTCSCTGHAHVQYMLMSMFYVKGRVARDFLLLVFSSNKPTWASDSYPNFFSNLFLFARYSNSKQDWPLYNIAASHSVHPWVDSCLISTLMAKGAFQFVFAIWLVPF